MSLAVCVASCFCHCNVLPISSPVDNINCVGDQKVFFFLKKKQVFKSNSLLPSHFPPNDSLTGLVVSAHSSI